jgi:hypothetical protein
MQMPVGVLKPIASMWRRTSVQLQPIERGSQANPTRTAALDLNRHSARGTISA